MDVIDTNHRNRVCISCRYSNLPYDRFPCCDCRNHSRWTDAFIGEGYRITVNPSSVTFKAFENILNYSLGIEKVIFNDPATIVIWKSGGKTVVKCQPGDTYDPEKGLALCIMKRALGDKGNYNNVFRKWLPEKGEQK